MSEREWHKVQLLARKMDVDIDETLESIFARLRGALSSYSVVSTDELIASARENVRLALTALAERRAPTTDELAAAARTAALRARQGVSVGDVLQGYRAVAREIWALFSNRAREQGIEAATLLEAAELVWAWTDAATMQAALEHRQAELEIARHDQQQRASFLIGILFGSANAADVRTRAAAYGLLADRSFVPFRARTLDGAPPTEVERELRRFFAEELILTGPVENDLAGLVANGRRGKLSGVVVGVGPEAPLGEMEGSFQIASRALETAAAFGMTGVFALEDVPLHAMIAAEPQIGAWFESRYLQPLSTAGRLGSLILHTLGAFFRHGHDVERTASVLSVHPNTVRYRLRRFEEITEASLARTSDLIGTWWALERRQLRPE